MEDKRLERVYRQRLLQERHDGNVTAAISAFIGVFVGFAFALPFYF